MWQDHTLLLYIMYLNLLCFSPLVPDKENLDRSDMSLSAGFESPTVKLVCIVGAYNMEKWGCGVGTILLSLILLP